MAIKLYTGLRSVAPVLNAPLPHRPPLGTKHPLETRNRLSDKSATAQQTTPAVSLHEKPHIVHIQKMLEGHPEKNKVLIALTLAATLKERGVEILEGLESSGTAHDICPLLMTLYPEDMSALLKIASNAQSTLCEPYPFFEKVFRILSALKNHFPIRLTLAITKNTLKINGSLKKANLDITTLMTLRSTAIDPRQGWQFLAANPELSSTLLHALSDKRPTVEGTCLNPIYAFVSLAIATGANQGGLAPAIERIAKTLL